MAEYHVTWEIDLDAEGPMEAAQIAMDIQQDPSNLATCFTVTDLDNDIYWLVDADPEEPSIKKYDPTKEQG